MTIAFWGSARITSASMRIARRAASKSARSVKRSF